VKIETKLVSQAGNNAVLELYFDGIRVGTLHCTPREVIELETKLMSTRRP